MFFRLSGLTVPDEPAEPDEDEDIEPRTFAIAEARDMVRRGEIVDMKTVVGLRPAVARLPPRFAGLTAPSA